MLVVLGYQVPHGSGLAFGTQIGGRVTRLVLSKQDSSIDYPALRFSGITRDTMFFTTGQNVILNSMIARLKVVAGRIPDTVLNIGTTDIKNHSLCKISLDSSQHIRMP